MVPAILDAISRSRYAALTEVIPDEADPYCATAAKGSGGVILTSDSDLLVYDLGDHGAVAFFNGLELHPSGNPKVCGTIEAAICRPADLARQLALENIQRLCFEIKEDPSITFLTALGLARLPVSKSAQLKEFLDQYSTPLLRSPSTVQKGFIDPQISEFLLQATSPSNPYQPPNFYLPTLLDDPSKTSAWACSTPLRFFAYSYGLVRSTHRRHHDLVYEHIRKGTRIVPQPVVLHSEAELFTYAANLSARIKNIDHAFPDIAKIIQWRTLALHEILLWYSASDKTPPSISTLKRAMSGIANDQTWTWEDIHLSAQIHSILYSLRIISQTLTTISPPSATMDPECFKELQTLLTTLPPLSQLLPSRLELTQQISAHVNIEHISETLTTMTKTQNSSGDIRDGNAMPPSNVAREPEWEEPKRKKKGSKARKREREKGREAREEATEGVGSNQFDILGYAGVT